jgi:hypothetical protein
MGYQHCTAVKGGILSSFSILVSVRFRAFDHPESHYGFRMDCRIIILGHEYLLLSAAKTKPGGFRVFWTCKALIYEFSPASPARVRPD